MKQYSKSFKAKNTEMNTTWAVKSFESWRQWRNQHNLSNPVPDNLLICNDTTLLNKWISYYVVETRKKDGERFPSKSINLLLAGLKRYMTEAVLEAGPFAVPVNILDESDTSFKGLRVTRDKVARELRACGIGAQVQHTEVFSTEEEKHCGRKVFYLLRPQRVC